MSNLVPIVTVGTQFEALCASLSDAERHTRIPTHSVGTRGETKHRLRVILNCFMVSPVNLNII